VLPPGAALLGQVIDAQTGRGLSRVIVELDGAGLRRRIVSDDRGRFLLSGLPPGDYRITASRAGFLNGSYGQQRPTGAPSVITLADGQWMSGIDLQLWRPAVVTGYVTDHDGAPISGVTVRAYRYDRPPGRTSVRQVGLAVTDDAGAYRLSSLLPGPHLVGISAQQMLTTATNEATGEVFTPEDPEVIFAPVYFPLADSALAASVVTAESGREFTGVNFALPASPMLQLSGRVDPASVPAGQMGAVRLLLARPVDPFVAESPIHRYLGSVSPDAEGHFTFTRVPRGDYVVEASAVGADTTAPERLWASQPVSLDDKDLTDVIVTMREGLNLSGQTRMVSSMGRGTALAGPLDISLEPLFEAPGVRPLLFRTDESGAFLSGPVLVPGRYLVRVGGVPPGWRLRGVMSGGVDVSDEGLDLSLGFAPSDLQIELTDQLTVLTGTVRAVGPLADATATVLVFPQQNRGMGARRHLSVRVGRDGQFSLRNLPAGAYLMIAVDDAGADGWMDPDRLATLRSRSTPVTIRDGEARVVELRRVTLR
jgi:hypothetical protein